MQSHRALAWLNALLLPSGIHNKFEEGASIFILQWFPQFVLFPQTCPSGSSHTSSIPFLPMFINQRSSHFPHETQGSAGHMGLGGLLISYSGYQYNCTICKIWPNANLFLYPTTCLRCKGQKRRYTAISPGPGWTLTQMP